jgi:hypothetical protein
VNEQPYRRLDPADPRARNSGQAAAWPIAYLARSRVSGTRCAVMEDATRCFHKLKQQITSVRTENVETAFPPTRAPLYTWVRTTYRDRTMSDQVERRLTAPPVEMRKRGADDVPLYAKLREWAISGVFPAHPRNNIWHFFEADVDTIIAALAADRRSTGFGK